KKLAALGASLEETVIVPDDMEMIADHVRRFLKADTDLIITTGGMSVDPDDVTRLGIRKAGVEELYYGAAALPGAMGMLAYKGQTPIIGIPACGLFHKTTVFDLLLPRLLAGEKPDNRDMARLAVGGMCLDCQVCRYPACSFGKS
ncbi:MAG: molybdopterin-binding protein, partial [Desulfobacteraceae bacterium]